MTTILVVDDEPAIREMLVFALEAEAYQCLEAGDARAARRLIKTEKPDLVVLDWMLPGQSGYDLACELRRSTETRDLPIILLTARDSNEHKVKGLDGGADDYVTKPFSLTELMARIRAMLRRAGKGLAAKEKLEIAGLTLNVGSHRIRAGNKNLDLAPTEFNLLRFFMSHPERVYSREQLIDHVWGYNAYVEDRTVDVHIRRLRKALAPGGHDRLVQTVRGAGYRFSSDI